MRICTLVAVIAAALLMIAPVPAAHAAKSRLWTLENGLTVLVQPDDRFPLVSMRLFVRAGASLETPEQAGISHLLEHMVFKGTKTRAPGQAAAEIEGAGGQFNAATSFDYTMYMADMPAESWTLGLEVISDMVSNVTLDPEELEREKKVVLAELERGEDSPGSRQFKTMQKMVWEGSPYARPVIGFRDTVSGFTREDILEYISAFYQPRSMLAVICGDVDPDKALKEVTRSLGGLKNDRVLAEPAPAPAPAPDGPQVAVEFGPWNKAYLSVAFPVPGLHSPDAAGLEVLAHILGGDETSRLERRFKYDLRLVDSVSTFSMTLERTGMFYLSATLDADNIDEFWTELARFMSGFDPASFTDQELDRAKLLIEDGLYRSKETLPGLASKLGYFQFFEDGLDAEARYIAAIKAVDRAQLARLGGQWLAPETMSASLLLPQNGGEAESMAAEMEKAVRDNWPAKDHKAQAAAAQTSTQIETIDLGRGRTMVLIPDQTLPYASVSLAYAGGDSLLSSKNQGLAELASRALTRGAGGLTNMELEDFLADRAADLSASAGRDSFVIGAGYPSRFADDMLGLMAKVIEEPALSADEIDRAREEQAASIVRREDQPLGLAFRRIFPFLFTGNAYSYLHQGQSPEDLDRYTPEDVRAFWADQRTRPFTMAVCGVFDRAKVLELARRLAAQPAKDFALDAPVWNKPGELNLHLAERNQAHLIVAFPVPGLDSPQSPGLDLLKTTLAGQGGLLFGELRDKQSLGYSVTAFIWQTPKAGFLAFYIGTSPDKLDQAMDGFKAITKQVQDNPLPEPLVARARNLLLGDYYREHQSLGSRSHEAAGLMIKGFPLNHNRQHIEQARKATAADLQNLAKTWLDWSKAYVLKVIP